MKHDINVEHDANGYKAVCSCGGYSLGYFTSEARAKRAMLNSTHADESKPKVQFVEVEGR